MNTGFSNNVQLNIKGGQIKVAVGTLHSKWQSDAYCIM